MEPRSSTTAAQSEEGLPASLPPGPSPAIPTNSPLPSSERAAPAPRLYAPLFSLLNPVDDTSITTTNTAAVAASPPPNSATTTFNAAGRAEQEAERLASESQPTSHTRRMISPTTEPLLSGFQTTTSTTPTPVATTSVPLDQTTNTPAPVHWWGHAAQIWADMQAARAREVLPVDQPRPFSASERSKMARYESVDTYEPESVLYKDHLETRSHEPRWFMWVFVLVLGLSTSALSLVMAACLHVLNSIRYELLGFGLRGFTFVDAQRYAANYTNHSSNSSSMLTPTSMDVWAMLKGRNVGLYGLAKPLAYGYGYLLWVLCAVVASALASGVCYLVPECVGSGIPEVKAYLNGVAYPMMRSTRVLVAKVVAVTLTVASGVCTGHYGLLMLAGAMLGAQLLQRRHGIRCYHVHLVDCFRNPRDRRVILVIGAAAGMASAFCVSVGGLLVILELLSAVFPVRFALYVFAACLLSTLCTQVYLSYWVNFDTRYRPGGGLQRGELLSEAVVLFRTHLPFGEHPAMNLMDFIAAFVIGACTGLCAVVFVRVSWAALYLRRRLEVALGTKAIRYVLPILFTFVYVSLHYAIAVGFTYEPAQAGDAHRGNSSGLTDSSSSSISSGISIGDGSFLYGRYDVRAAAEGPVPVVCRSVPYAVRSGRNVTTISFYGMNGFLCPAVDLVEESREAQNELHDPMPPQQKVFYHPAKSQRFRPQRWTSESTKVDAADMQSSTLREEQSVRVVDTYASLAFAYADSTLQTLLSQRTAALLPWRALLTYTVVYFFSSALYSGLALCGDTLLPSLVIGAALGRCVGTAVHVTAVAVSPDAAAWADPGVFALFGAGSFVSATSGLSFGIGAILIESTADFRHLLPLMFAILVARRVLARWSRDVLTMYLEARAVPLLNAEPHMNRFVLLDARHVMHGPVVALPVVCSLSDIAQVLRGTTHHGFPVVSAHDGTCKGIVTRAQLTLLLWHLVMTQGRVSHCTYDVLQRVENHVFHRHWESCDPVDFLPPDRLRAATQISLYPHVDTSAFTVLDTTALSCVYEMFTTLGLRHLVVVDRSNYAVGVITRKDLTGDHLLRAQQREEEVARQQQEHQQRSRDIQGVSVAAGRDGCSAFAAAQAVLRGPLHPTAAQVAEVARTSSTRRLQQQRQEQQHQVLNNNSLLFAQSQTQMQMKMQQQQQQRHASPVRQGGGEELYAQALRRVSLLQMPRRADGPLPGQL